MHITPARRASLVNRTLTSLAAIAVVSAIFGLKAADLEHRADAAEAAKVAAAALKPGA